MKIKAVNIDNIKDIKIRLYKSIFTLRIIRSPYKKLSVFHKRMEKNLYCGFCIWKYSICFHHEIFQNRKIAIFMID